VRSIRVARIKGEKTYRILAGRPQGWLVQSSLHISLCVTDMLVTSKAQQKSFKFLCKFKAPLDAEFPFCNSEYSVVHAKVQNFSRKT
jgi:hypothetical protein